MRTLRERVHELLGAFSKNVVVCGPLGAGHATKAMNNALNTGNLLLAMLGPAGAR